MKKRVFIIIIHILVWVAFMSLPVAFKPDRTGHLGNDLLDDMSHTHRWLNAVFFISFFYLNYLIFMPRYYFGRKYYSLSLALFLSFTCFFLINYAITPTDPADRPPGYNVFGPGYNVFMFIIVFIFSFALSLYNQWRITSEEKMGTEISFLKAQINPHFLFNTLNSIYSLAITKSDYTPEAIVKLSGIMRYSVSEVHNAMVPLDKEITYITNYIDLQRLRLTNKVNIRYELKVNNEGLKIAPFILIPFIENAFKYGVSTGEYSDIIVAIDVNEYDLLLQVSNTKVYVKRDKDMGIGLGIENTKYRLKLLYPRRHALTITDTDKSFSVSLYLNIR